MTKIKILKIKSSFFDDEIKSMGNSELSSFTRFLIENADLNISIKNFIDFKNLNQRKKRFNFKKYITKFKQYLIFNIKI